MILKDNLKQIFVETIILKSQELMELVVTVIPLE